KRRLAASTRRCRVGLGIWTPRRNPRPWTTSQPEVYVARQVGGLGLRGGRPLAVLLTWPRGFRASMHAVVEELFAGDPVVLADGVEADLFDGLPLAGALARNVEGEVDGELVRAVEERPADLLAVDVVILLPDFGLVDDRLLALGLV